MTLLASPAATSWDPLRALGECQVGPRPRMIGPARAGDTDADLPSSGAATSSKAMKQIAAAQQRRIQSAGLLHQGGAAAILPKIKAAWPARSIMITSRAGKAPSTPW